MVRTSSAAVLLALATSAASPALTQGRPDPVALIAAQKEAMKAFAAKLDAHLPAEAARQPVDSPIGRWASTAIAWAWQAGPPRRSSASA